ncbi:MAG: AMP-binding protein, partial [Gammaproteobacteria bacterium]
MYTQTVNATYSNDTYPIDKYPHEIFADYTKAMPGNDAIYDFELSQAGAWRDPRTRYRTMTYSELDKASNQLAHYLQDRGFKKGDRLGLLFGRSREYLVALLACWKLGLTVMPFSWRSKDKPEDNRNRFLVHLLQAQIDGVITNDFWNEVSGEFRTEFREVYDSIASRFRDHVIYLDSNLSNIQACSSEIINSERPEANEVAYICCSSGTTGLPKMIAVPWGQISYRMKAAIMKLGIKPAERVMTFCDFEFDASLMEILMALNAGACLTIVPQCVRSASNSELPAWFKYWREKGKAQEYTILLPSVLSLLHASDLRDMKAFITTGEKCNAVDMKRFLEKNIKVFNGYGPVETTFGATLTELSSHDEYAPVWQAMPGITMVFATVSEDVTGNKQFQPVRYWDENSPVEGNACLGNQASVEGESVQQTVSRVTNSGLKYEQLPGDGHCLYRAVSLYLDLDVQALRNRVASNIEDNLSSYVGIIRAINPHQTPQDYINAIRNGEEWADHLEIAILMQVLNRPIVIMSPDGSIRNKTDIGQNSGEPIFVYYNGHNHYDGLILINSGEQSGSSILQSLTQLNEQSLEGLKGELLIGSKSGMAHYLGERAEDLNSVKFKQLPGFPSLQFFIPNDGATIIDNRLQFTGRTDRTIKRNGEWLNLEEQETEIEKLLREKLQLTVSDFIGVTYLAKLETKERRSFYKLCLFIYGANNTETINQVLKTLDARSRPHEVFKLNTWLKTARDKKELDYERLKSHACLLRFGDTPLIQDEVKINEIWKSVLYFDSNETLLNTDSFYDVGGDSLTRSGMLNSLCTKLLEWEKNKTLMYEEIQLLQNPGYITIQNLAKFVSIYRNVWPSKKAAGLTFLVILRENENDLEHKKNKIEALGGAWLVCPEYYSDTDKVKQSFVQTRLLREIKGLQPQGPYHIFTLDPVFQKYLQDTLTPSNLKPEDKEKWLQIDSLSVLSEDFKQRCEEVKEIHQPYLLREQLLSGLYEGYGLDLNQPVKPFEQFENTEVKSSVFIVPNTYSSGDMLSQYANNLLQERSQYAIRWKDTAWPTFKMIKAYLKRLGMIDENITYLIECKVVVLVDGIQSNKPISTDWPSNWTCKILLNASVAREVREIPQYFHWEEINMDLENQLIPAVLKKFNKPWGYVNDFLSSQIYLKYHEEIQSDDEKWISVYLYYLIKRFFKNPGEYDLKEIVGRLIDTYNEHKIINIEIDGENKLLSRWLDINERYSPESENLSVLQSSIAPVIRAILTKKPNDSYYEWDETPEWGKVLTGVLEIDEKRPRQAVNESDIDRNANRFYRKQILSQGKKHTNPLWLFSPITGELPKEYEALVSRMPELLVKAYCLSETVLIDDLPTISEMAEQLSHDLIQEQPTGPYVLGGWSMGGLMAYAVSEQIIKTGRKPVTILNLDMPFPLYAINGEQLLGRAKHLLLMLCRYTEAFGDKKKDMEQEIAKYNQQVSLADIKEDDSERECLDTIRKGLFTWFESFIRYAKHKLNREFERQFKIAFFNLAALLAYSREVKRKSYLEGANVLEGANMVVWQTTQEQNDFNREEDYQAWNVLQQERIKVDDNHFEFIYHDFERKEYKIPEKISEVCRQLHYAFGNLTLEERYRRYRNRVSQKILKETNVFNAKNYIDSMILEYGEERNLEQNGNSVSIKMWVEGNDRSIQENESVQQTVSRVTNNGLKYEQLQGDGHCLYRAVSLYSDLDVQALRNRVASSIEHNLSSYEGVIRAINPHQTPQDYINAIRNGEEWADNLEIAILMQVLNRPIVIMSPDGSIRNRTDIGQYSGEPIFVYYNGHNHYDGLILTNQGEERSQSILQSLTQLNEQSRNVEQNGNSVSIKMWVEGNDRSIQENESVQQTVSRVTNNGLKYEQLQGDGHCLYRAVSLYSDLDVQALRNRVASSIEHNLSSYEGVIRAINPHQTPQDYINAIRNGEEWADNLEIAILMQVLNRPIVIMSPDGSIRNRTDIGQYSGEPIFVYYNGHNHYDGLILTNQGEERSQSILQSLTQLNEQSRNVEQNGNSVSIKMWVQGNDRSIQENRQEDREERQKTLLLLGEAGVGKSMALKNLHYQTIQGNNYLPIYISFADFPKENDFQRILELVICKKLSLTKREFDGEFKKANIPLLLLIDGYDEHTPLKLDCQWLREYTGCLRMVVSSKIQGYKHAGEIQGGYFNINGKPPTICQILPFNEQQREIYCNKTPEGKALLAWLKNNPYLKEAFNNPLLLSLAIKVGKPFLDQLSSVSQNTWSLYQIYELLTSKQCMGFIEENQLDKNHELAFLNYAQSLALKHWISQESNEAFVKTADYQYFKKSLFLSDTSNTGFIHRSVYEFYIAQACVRVLLETDPGRIEYVWGSRLFSGEETLLQFICDGLRNAKNEEIIQSQLMKFILASKNDSATENQKILAANAITVLVQLEYDFKKCDLSNIKIPGADLSGGKFENANFTGADLSNTNLSNISLKNARMVGVQINGAQWGELPLMRHSGKIIDAQSVHEKPWIVTASRNILYLWDVEKQSLLRQEAFDQEISSFSVSKDGQYVVTAHAKTESAKPRLRILFLDNFGNFELRATHELEYDLIETQVITETNFITIFGTSASYGYGSTIIRIRYYLVDNNFLPISEVKVSDDRKNLRVLRFHILCIESIKPNAPVYIKNLDTDRNDSLIKTRPDTESVDVFGAYEDDVYLRFNSHQCFVLSQASYGLVGTLNNLTGKVIYNTVNCNNEPAEFIKAAILSPDFKHLFIATNKKNIYCYTREMLEKQFELIKVVKLTSLQDIEQIRCENNNRLVLLSSDRFFHLFDPNLEKVMTSCSMGDEKISNFILRNNKLVMIPAEGETMLVKDFDMLRQGRRLESTRLDLNGSIWDEAVISSETSNRLIIQMNGETVYNEPFLSCLLKKKQTKLIKLLSEFQPKAINKIRFSENKTLIHYLIKYNSLTVLEYLLKRSDRNEIFFNTSDVNGFSPLACAFLEENENAIDLLTQENVKLNENEIFELATQLIKKNLLEKLNQLILLVGDNLLQRVNLKGQNILHIAVEAERLEIISKLSTQFTSLLDEKDHQGQTPFYCAVITGNVEVVKSFPAPSDIGEGMKHKFVEEQNSNLWSPLYAAARHGYFEIVKSLVEKFKANLFSKSQGGWLSIHEACFRGHIKITEYHLQKDRSLLNVRCDTKRTPFHRAATCGHTEILKMLLDEFKVDINDKDENEGWTALHRAANGNHETATADRKS